MRLSFLVLFLFLTTAFIQAQPGTDKSQLEKERQEIQKELKEIQTLYESVKGQTKKNLEPAECVESQNIAAGTLYQ